MTVSSQVKQTLATLKAAQSTLRSYSIKSQEEDASKAYQDALKTTGIVIDSLEERLQILEYEEPQYKGY